ITGAEATEGFAHLAHAFAASKHPVETVGMDIVEAQELFDAVAAMVGRAPAHGLAAAGPGDASDRTDFQRPPFVEADYGRARRASPIEPPDAFFLRSKSGSAEVFQVRMRCAERPSRRNSRRTPSSVTGGSRRRWRQYSGSCRAVASADAPPEAHLGDYPISLGDAGRERQVFDLGSEPAQLGRGQRAQSERR